MLVLVAFFGGMFFLVNSFSAYVLVKNKFSLKSVLYALSAFFFSAWSVSAAVSENHTGDLEVNNLANRLAFLFAFAGASALYLFIRQFSSQYSQHKTTTTQMILGIMAVGVISVLLISEFIAGNVQRAVDGQLIFYQGSLVMIAIPIYLVLVIGVVKNLFVIVKKGNYAEKNQARFIIFSLVVASAVALFTNILLPAFYPKFNQTGILNACFTLLLTFPVGYALMKHRIADVRPLAARSLAISFLIANLVIVYSAALLSLNNIFYNGQDISPGTFAAYIAAFIGIGLLIKPISVFYQSIFNNMFIKHVYDSQEVVSELNSAMATNLKTEGIIEQIQKVIRTNLGAKFTVVKFPANHRVYHQGRANGFTKADLAKLDMAIADTYRRKKKIITTRDVLLEQSGSSLVNIMLDEHISVVAYVRHGGHLLATLYVSDKDNELPYTNQDLDIIEIVVSQAGLALQNSILYEELGELNSSLKGKVFDATKELRQSNAKLLAMDKAKDEFISISSHQLRTPVTTIKGYMSMLLEGNFGRLLKAQRPPLEQSLENSHRISFVVSDLLNLMRLRTDTFDIEQSRGNISEIVESELGYLKEKLKSNNISLSTEIDPNIPELMIDEVKMRQVIKNFLYNAIFYTKAGGEVAIKLAQTPDTVSFSVTDTGIGVPKSAQNHLFTQFFRAENAKIVRPDGTGVGLYIAKAVIKAHKGQIIFESVEGKGSTFGFSLSKKPLETVKK